MACPILVGFAANTGRLCGLLAHIMLCGLTALQLADPYGLYTDNGMALVYGKKSSLLQDEWPMGDGV